MLLAFDFLSNAFMSDVKVSEIYGGAYDAETQSVSYLRVGIERRSARITSLEVVREPGLQPEAGLGRGAEGDLPTLSAISLQIRFTIHRQAIGA